MKPFRRYSGSKKIFYDIRSQEVVDKKNDHTVTLDSQLELKCFQIIEKYWESPVIDVHVPTPLFPPNSIAPKGRDWRIDFRVPNGRGKPPLWIEVKGLLDGETLMKLMASSIHNPTAFSNLLIVHSNGIKIPRWAKELNAIPINQFDAFLASGKLDSFLFQNI